MRRRGGFGPNVGIDGYVDRPKPPQEVPLRGRRDSGDNTDRWSRSDWWGIVLDAPTLADFHAELLGRRIVSRAPEFRVMDPGDGVAYIAAQTVPDYRTPQWPNAAGSRQMMIHLDFEVAELTTAVEHALELGATLANVQPQDDVRVLLDPAGHPFCLYLGDAAAPPAD